MSLHLIGGIECGYFTWLSCKNYYKLDLLANTFFFWKLGIRSKDRLIREDQSHRPLAGAPFKARASSVWTYPIEIGTRGNQTWDLWRSKLQDPKPTTRPTPNGFHWQTLSSHHNFNFQFCSCLSILLLFLCVLFVSLH